MHTYSNKPAPKNNKSEKIMIFKLTMSSKALRHITDVCFLPGSYIPRKEIVDLMIHQVPSDELLKQASFCLCFRKKAICCFFQYSVSDFAHY